MTVRSSSCPSIVGLFVSAVAAHRQVPGIARRHSHDHPAPSIRRERPTLAAIALILGVLASCSPANGETVAAAASTSPAAAALSVTSDRSYWLEEHTDFQRFSYAKKQSDWPVRYDVSAYRVVHPGEAPQYRIKLESLNLANDGVARWWTFDEADVRSMLARIDVFLSHELTDVEDPVTGSFLQIQLADNLSLRRSKLSDPALRVWVDGSGWKPFPPDRFRQIFEHGLRSIDALRAREPSVHWKD